MPLKICLTPQDVETRLSRLGIPCSFTVEEREAYSTTPVVDCAEPALAFPTPSTGPGLTLSLIRASVGVDPRRQPSVFDHPWYQAEAFMNAPCAPGWHILQMDVLPESLGQPVGYAGRLRARGLMLPAGVEVVLMLFLHYAGTGVQLLGKKHTWCSDRASTQRAVTVGAFGRNGVFVSAHPENFASRGLGICGKLTGVG
jgi:hypothetical protein